MEATHINPYIKKDNKKGTEDQASGNRISRRSFMFTAGIAGLGAGLAHSGCVTGKNVTKKTPPIQGFDETVKTDTNSIGWTPVSDRKIRVGIVGYGVCRFGAAFGFQNHPNVEIVAVSDLFPDRCNTLAKLCNCSKTYPSLEELVKDDKIEAVFIATDAPSHAQHSITALQHGKHVACAVPAVFGSLEEADRLFEAVKTCGLTYMMFETSCFREDLYAMYQIYKAGGFGKLLYSEGEYFHYMEEPIDSYKNWRVGLPPQWYPTHSNAYYIGVGGGVFTEVSCIGMPSLISHLQPENNIYNNPFGTEIAIFKTSEGGVSRMGVSWDTPGDSGERGRVRGQRGTYYEKYQGLEKSLPDIKRPPLPPSVPAGSHGGSHGYLMNEFILSLLQNRLPLVDVAVALNMTVPGIIAHQSALKNGELMKIPKYQLNKNI